MSLSRWLSSVDGKRMQGYLKRGIDELTRFNDNSDKLMKLLRDPLVGGAICEVITSGRMRGGTPASTLHERIKEVLDG